MGDDATELVRHAYEAWNEHGTERLGPFLADEVELTDWAELADADVWRGRAAVLARLDDVRSRVGGGWVELHDVRAEDGGAVRVEMEWKLDRGDDVGASLGRVCHVVEVEEGAISSIRVELAREG